MFHLPEISEQIQRQDVTDKEAIISPGRAVRVMLENMGFLLHTSGIFFFFWRESGQQKVAIHVQQSLNLLPSITKENTHK